MAEWWGAQWYSRNRLDGETRHIIYNGAGLPVMFRTRQEARQWIRREYGYIRHREDLRKEPHGWRMPRAKRIKVSVKVVE